MKSTLVLSLPLLSLFVVHTAFAQPDAPPTSPTPPSTPPPASTSDTSANAPIVPTTPAAPNPDATPTPSPTDVSVATNNASADTAPPPGNNPALAKDGYPLAGWHGGLFYLRDANDNFRLYVQGRAQIDSYNYLGPGVSSSTTLVPTVFLRRIRPELTGEIMKNWQFSIAGDFGATSLDNPKGSGTETSAAAPGAAPSATSGKYAGAQTAHIGAAPTDVYLNFRGHPLFNMQVGQFDAPFMMENRTSDKYLPFMERSMAVRDIGIPTNKEIGAMAWGEMENKLVFYSLGLFNGDGQNRLNTDARGDFMARAFAHPLATSTKSELKDLQIGGSFRYGSRDRQDTNYDYNGFSTQGNYTFWSPTYAGSKGTTRIIPAGSQLGVAGELRVPFWKFDLQSEVIYVNNGTREAVDGFQSTNTERYGAMHGASYYAFLDFWAFGARDVNGGIPGYENPSHVDFKKADAEIPNQSLQFLVKWEQMLMSYDSASRAGTPDAKNIDGDIKVNVFELGANFWATKHIRLSANYAVDMFPDSAPTSASAAGGPVQSSKNRAQAPGNTLGKGVDDSARDGAHTLHEILFRVAVAL